jgi:hypothetical protein
MPGIGAFINKDIKLQFFAIAQRTLKIFVKIDSKNEDMSMRSWIGIRCRRVFELCRHVFDTFIKSMIPGTHSMM